MNRFSLDTNSTADREIIDLTEYGIRSALVIGKYHYNSARGGLVDHSHEDMIEIKYCHKGRQVYEVNGRPYTLKGGDVFVTFPGEVHGTGTFPEEKGIIYWMFIYVPPGTTFFNCDKPDGDAFVNALTSLPQRHFKGLPNMRKTLDEILEASKETGPLRKVKLVNLIVRYLLQVIDAAKSSSSERPVTGKAEKISSFINDNYKENLNIKRMAEILHLSESRFKSWFKSEFGIPPLEFVLRKRIEEAKNAMESTNATNITNLAYDLGFSSPQHFVTIFKRYTLLTPGQFKYQKKSLGETSS